jgi:hypothetical protein
MTRGYFNKIMKISKTICILVFQICFFGSMFLSVLFPFKEKMYGVLIILIWILGAVPYITHYWIVPFFITRVLNIKIERDIVQTGK